MAQSPVRAVFSAAMTWPGHDLQTGLYEELENSESLYDLALALPLKSLQQANFLEERRIAFSIAKTVEALTENANTSWEMYLLVHCMSRDMVRSLVQGTVAYDSRTNKTKWHSPPGLLDGKVPGVYVVGLECVGRGGKFLTATELDRLSLGLHDYIQGFQVMETIPPLQRTTADAQQVTWVEEVDSAFDPPQIGNAATKTAATFISAQGDALQIKSLKEGFEARRVVSLGFDPSGQTPLEQSPLYVGCSTDLKSRMSNYVKQNLKTLNKPLALTIHVLKRLGIDVDMCCKVAMRTWKPEQLPLAEQLVALLSMSYVVQTGFNTKEAGGISGTTSTTNETYMLSTSCVLYENMEATQDEIDKREVFLAELGWLGGMISDATEATERLEERMRALPDVFFQDLMRSQQLKLERAMEKKRKWELVRDLKFLLHAMTPKPS